MRRKLWIKITSQSKNGQRQQRVANVLSQLARSTISIDYCHTYSHIGNPWNELADSLAKFFTKHNDRAHRLPQKVSSLLQDTPELMWLPVSRTPDIAMQYPPLDADGFIIQHRPASKAFPPKTIAPTEQATISFKLGPRTADSGLFL